MYYLRTTFALLRRLSTAHNYYYALFQGIIPERAGKSESDNTIEVQKALENRYEGTQKGEFTPTYNTELGVLMITHRQRVHNRHRRFKDFPETTWISVFDLKPVILRLNLMMKYQTKHPLYVLVRHHYDNGTLEKITLTSAQRCKDVFM